MTVEGNTKDVSFSKNGEFLAVKTDTNGIFVFKTDNWEQSQNILNDKTINSIDFSNDKLLINFNEGTETKTALWVTHGNGAFNLIVSSMIMILGFLLYWVFWDLF